MVPQTRGSHMSTIRSASLSPARHWLFVFSIALAAACDGGMGTDPSRVGSVEVTNVPLSLRVGEPAQLIAVVLDENGKPVAGKNVYWASLNKNVVDMAEGNTGRVIARAPGTAQVGATSDDKTGFATVTVTGPAVNVEVGPTAFSLPQGESRKLDVFVRDGLGSTIYNPTVAWSSSNTNVATVTAAGGVVTAVGVGSAQITASSENRSGSAQVTVTAAPVATVEITPPSVSLAQNRTQQLSATLRDGAGNVLSGREIAWSSSAGTVAQVNGSGLVSARAQGTSVITATSEGRSGTVQVTVTAPVSLKLEVLPAAPALPLGDSMKFNAILREDGGGVLTGHPVIWQSSQPGVAPISTGGMARGDVPGTTTITATSEGVSASTTLSVLAPVPAISGLAPDTATAGRVTDLTVVVTGSGFARTSRVRWNGTDRTTVFVNTTQLQATLTPTDLRSAGRADITVFTPAPGGGTTPAAPFRIEGVGSIPLNTIIADELSPAGDVDEFTFVGTARQEFNFFMQGMSGAGSHSFRLRVLDPSGNSLGSVTSRGNDASLPAQSLDRVRLPVNGIYRVRVEGTSGTEVGDYRFLVERINTAPETRGAAVTVDAVITGEDVALGDIDEFTFTGTGGQDVNVFFQAMSGSSNDALRLSLLAPNGAELFYLDSYGDDFTLEEQSSGRYTLTASGTWTVRVRGHDSGDSGKYRFHVVPIDRTPEKTDVAIPIGTSVDDEDISPRGDMDQYTLTVPARQEVNVYLQARSGSSRDRLVLRVINSAGSSLGSVTSSGDDLTLEGQVIGLLTLSAGVYRVQVNGSSHGASGPYTFLVRPVVPAPEKVGAALALGTAVTQEDLAPVGDVDEFTFEGQAGQKVRLEFQATTGSYRDEFYVRLLTPGRDELIYVYSDGGDIAPQATTVTLAQAGRYILRVHGANSSDDAGRYWLRVSAAN